MGTSDERASSQRRQGRWRTGEESRQRILDAARVHFAQYGYDRTTIRWLATEARVDPAMIHYFFNTKAELFAAAMALPMNPAERLATLLEEGVDGLGPRIVRYFLQAWDETGGFEPLFALLRSAPTDERSAGMLQEFIQQELVGQLRRAIGPGAADAHLRAELVGSHLMGMALGRYILRIEPLASSDPDTVAAWMGPALQRYLTHPAPQS